jgi:hypothetical protein
MAVVNAFWAEPPTIDALRQQKVHSCTCLLFGDHPISPPREIGPQKISIATGV